VSFQQIVKVPRDRIGVIIGKNGKVKGEIQDKLIEGEEDTFQLIDLRDYAGKSSNSMERIKGRIIGEEGKSRRTIEDLTGAYISVYGHTVALIGKSNEIRIASDAVTMLSKGKSHKSVYNMLQEARRKAKMDRMRLWEDNNFPLPN
jgi:ribosomal RNA assembly protein